MPSSEVPRVETVQRSNFVMRIVWEMKSTLLLIASRKLVKEEINLKQQKKKQGELKIGRKKSPRNRNQHVQERLFLIHFLLYYIIITTCKDAHMFCASISGSRPARNSSFFWEAAS